jgi:predicted CoA-binding protein
MGSATADNPHPGRSSHHVVLLGASPNPERYANRAQRLLVQAGYRVTPVNPRHSQIETLAVTHNLLAVKGPVDTLTLYLRPELLNPLGDQIVALAPARVIFNPGSESTQLQQLLDAQGIPWLEACTLVMLNIGSF